MALHIAIDMALYALTGLITAFMVKTTHSVPVSLRSYPRWVNRSAWIITPILGSIPLTPLTWLYIGIVMPLYQATSGLYLHT